MAQLAGPSPWISTQLKGWSLGGGTEKGVAYWSLLCWWAVDRSPGLMGVHGSSGRNLCVFSGQPLVQEALLPSRAKICSWKNLAPAMFLKRTYHAFPVAWLCFPSALMSYSCLGFCCFPFSPLAGYSLQPLPEGHHGLWQQAYGRCSGSQLSILRGKRNTRCSRWLARPFLSAHVLPPSLVPRWPYVGLGLLSSVIFSLRSKWAWRAASSPEWPFQFI